MVEGGDNVVVIIDPTYGSGISQSHEVGGNYQHLFNLPRPDYQQVYLPHAEHVVSEYDVLIGEDLEVLGVISLPHVVTSANQFCIHNINEDFFNPNP